MWVVVNALGQWLPKRKRGANRKARALKECTGEELHKCRKYSREGARSVLCCRLYCTSVSHSTSASAAAAAAFTASLLCVAVLAAIPAAY